jgi:glycosyltransferase involved in cell wall biosynthesis
VGSYTGILVANGDEPALGRAILSLVNDPARRRQLGAAARERSGDYSLAAVAARWRELLDGFARKTHCFPRSGIDPKGTA